MSVSIKDTATIEIGNRTFIISEISISDLAVQYFVGRGNKLGKGRPETYYHGIQTAIGEMPHNTWIELIEYLVQREQEESIQEALFRWVKQECVWLRTDAERHFYALQLHAQRIFENKDWGGYAEFRESFFPLFFVREGFGKKSVTHSPKS